MRKNLDPTTDRTAGEEVMLNGRGLVVSGTVPMDLEISFTGQDGERYTFATVRDWFVPSRFTSLWVFHSSLAVSLIGGSLASAPLRFALGLQSYDDLGAIPNAGAVPDRVPQLRNGDGPLAFEDARTPQLAICSSVTAVATTVLAGSAGQNRVRLFAYRLMITGDASQAVAGLMQVTLSGGGGFSLTHRFYVPAAAANVFGGFSTPWITLGNGIVGAGGGAFLASLNAAFVTGGVEVEATYSWERVT